jgi:hypothetical protein
MKQENPPPSTQLADAAGGSGARFELMLNDAICSGSSGGTSVDFDDPNGVSYVADNAHIWY